VCIDANAGARAAAREKARQKDAVFAQEKLKFFNKETSFSRTLNRNVIGYSRDFSDAYVQALYTQGKVSTNYVFFSFSTFTLSI
jgi:hypothetical protein